MIFVLSLSLSLSCLFCCLFACLFFCCVAFDVVIITLLLISVNKCVLCSLVPRMTSYKKGVDFKRLWERRGQIRKLQHVYFLKNCARSAVCIMQQISTNHNKNHHNSSFLYRSKRIERKKKDEGRPKND